MDCGQYNGAGSIGVEIMQIRIEEIFNRELKTVGFDGPAGRAWGHWRGDGDPQLGTYDVEFDIPDPLASWSVSEAGKHITVGKYSTNTVTIRGTIQAFDDDQVVTIRVLDDIILVEVAATITPLPIGTSVEFTTSDLQIYPYFM
ncbi:hypothetical protein ABZ532_06680 [Streptomyces sp. NPDC019396]|uniref:hypothetical protein n=1 Tax=Streptomyces sp. NPDC019396 TaxID=3154687 RepID=UPI0033C39A38